MAQPSQAQQQATLDAGIIAQQQQYITDLQAQIATAPQPTPAPAPSAPSAPALPDITAEEIAAAADQAFAAAFVAALQRASAG